MLANAMTPLTHSVARHAACDVLSVATAESEDPMNPIVMTALGGLAALMTLSGCAAINKTRPGDMTVPEHEQAARTEARSAGLDADHAARVGAGRSYERYRYAAARHRELAQEHAAAAERRRAEVAAACDGVVHSTPVMAMKVERVEEIREANVPRELRNPRGYYPERLRGARIVLEAPPGGAQSAVRSIACEAARDSAGLDDATARRSPFAVRTARSTAHVGKGSGVIVEIRSPEREDAAEILERAQAIAAASASTR